MRPASNKEPAFYVVHLPGWAASLLAMKAVAWVTWVTWSLMEINSQLRHRPETVSIHLERREKTPILADVSLGLDHILFPRFEGTNVRSEPSKEK